MFFFQLLCVWYCPQDQGEEQKIKKMDSFQKYDYFIYQVHIDIVLAEHHNPHGNVLEKGPKYKCILGLFSRLVATLSRENVNMKKFQLLEDLNAQNQCWFSYELQPL